MKFIHHKIHLISFEHKKTYEQGEHMLATVALFTFVKIFHYEFMLSQYVCEIVIKNDFFQIYSINLYLYKILNITDVLYAQKMYRIICLKFWKKIFKSLYGI